MERGRKKASPAPNAAAACRCCYALAPTCLGLGRRRGPTWGEVCACAVRVRFASEWCGWHGRGQRKKKAFRLGSRQMTRSRHPSFFVGDQNGFQNELLIYLYSTKYYRFVFCFFLCVKSALPFFLFFTAWFLVWSSGLGGVCPSLLSLITTSFSCLRVLAN